MLQSGTFSIIDKACLTTITITVSHTDVERIKMSLLCHCDMGETFS